LQDGAGLAQRAHFRYVLEKGGRIVFAEAKKIKGNPLKELGGKINREQRQGAKKEGEWGSNWGEERPRCRRAQSILPSHCNLREKS